MQHNNESWTIEVTYSNTMADTWFPDKCISTFKEGKNFLARHEFRVTSYSLDPPSPAEFELASPEGPQVDDQLTDT
ncbi:hypothetical protein HS121_03865 [bacterium]|nr:hypothetical protein [bacterium]